MRLNIIGVVGVVGIVVLGISGSALSKTMSKFDIPYKDIDEVRVYANNHPTSSASNTATIRASGLGAGCTQGKWLNHTENSAGYSSILTGYMAGKDLHVRVNKDSKSPWGDPEYCELVHVRVVQ